MTRFNAIELHLLEKETPVSINLLCTCENQFEIRNPIFLYPNRQTKSLI